MSALAGIRVLDFSRLAPGPYCSMLLADMGADVVRIDRAPLGVDEAPFGGDVIGRGKRSIALDLKHPDGAAAARRLAGRTDVLLEGFRPGVMERLGLGPDELSADNPGLVYARITGWGQQGPLADRAGHDVNYLAIAGALGAIGRAGSPPVPPINLVADFAGGGLMGAFGILCALVERQRSGAGQVIDAAMVDGTINLMSVFAVAVQDGSWGPYGTNVIDTGSHFYETYETADHGYMAVGAMEPVFYARFIEGIGLDPATLPHQMDESSWPAMKGQIAAIFRSKTRAEWTEVFATRDACVEPVLTPLEALDHPHNRARGTFVRRSPGFAQPGPAPRLSRTPGHAAEMPPEPGAQTREVLAEAGYSIAEIEDLARAGAAAWP